MTDTGVLHATACLRVAAEVTGVLYSGLQHNPIGMSAATADQKPHRVHQRKRPTRNGRQLFAFLHVFPVTNIGPANLLWLIEHHLVDAVAFLVRVFVLHDLFVLAGIASSFALMTRTRAQGTGNQLAALVVIASLDVLDYQASGELALLLFQAYDSLNLGTAITRAPFP